MKIISLVTLVSPLGEYGGPVRVAVNQARALADLGHEVRIVGGARGFADGPPTELDGVPATLFDTRQVIPRTGFAGLAAPGLTAWLKRRLGEADVLHAHLARDLVTLPAAALARRRGVRYVAQTHGMIDPSSNPLAIPLDRALTVPALRGAAAVLHLTEVERQGLTAVAGNGLPLRQLSNGVPEAEPAVGPAADETAEREVLYLARLAPRKRPLIFVEAAVALAAEFPGVRFRLVGPDEGEGPAVQDAVRRAQSAGVDIVWEGPLPPEQTVQRMQRAAAYVLPSIDEPYPMSVLEAMSVGLPVIITDSCGLAGFVAEQDAGQVVSADPDELIAALRVLLADPAASRARGDHGRNAVRRELSMTAIAEQLITIYRG